MSLFSWTLKGFKKNPRPVAVIAGLGIVLVFFASYKFYFDKHSEVAIRVAPVGGDFSLKAFPSDISLAQLKGHGVLIYFGFTSCPKICPTMLGRISQAIASLDEKQSSKVKVVFVSVDPERDGVEDLQKYISRFGGQFIAGTQSVERLQQIAASYGAYFAKMPIAGKDDYTMDHSTQVFFVDAEGRFVGEMPETSSVEDLKNKILSLTQKTL